MCFFFFKQKTAYEMRISDWSSDVCSSDLALFERLCEHGEQTVGALTADAGVSQPAVSKHLAILRQAGLVIDRQQGRQAHYSARPAALAPLADWTGRMTGFWQARLDRKSTRLNSSH